MTYPTNPYIEMPATLSAPIVAGGTAATVAYGQMPGVPVITVPTGALYDTTTNPLVISPTAPGLIVFVLNAQATALRATTGSSTGFVVPPNSQAQFSVAGGALVLLSSTAGVSGGPGTARAVVTAALPAYTMNGNVLTANAVGAPGAIFDGVTPVAEDTVLLPAGIALAPADAGPYIITQVGTAGLKQIMTRPTWWTMGGFVQEGSSIKVQEGTVFKNTSWSTWVTTATVVVGTSDPLLYPDEVTQYFANLNGTGTRTVSNVPVRSATLTEVRIMRKAAAGAGIANTVGYWPTQAGVASVTAGALGTASVIVEAVIAAGTINATDNSAVTITIKNK